MMKKKETAKWTAVICGCLTLLAVGFGVFWQAADYKSTLPITAEGANDTEITPVTLSQTPTVDETLLERDKKSNDGGEAPTAAAPVKKPQPKVQPKAEPVFSYPVAGDVVMSYSADRAIYDPTLEQYRTNPCISLSAEAGTIVQAAEGGNVKEVKQDETHGNTVVLEHNSGWLTTYSQLAGEIPVKTGQTVKKGQTIGAVGKPTKYSVALGTHLEFALEKDGESQNPEKVIKE